MNPAAYHAHSALSATRLKKALTGTARRFHVPVERTDAMRQGSLVDCLALTPDLFEHRYVVAPEGLDRRTRDGKAWWAEASQGKREIISHDWHVTAASIVVHLLSDSAIRPLIEQASQQIHFWFDADGVECRYLPDIEAPGLLVDMKKAARVGPAGFAADAYARGYDVQMAHYLLGHLDKYETADLPRVGFIAYEWHPRPDVGLYWLPGEWIEEGLRRREIAKARVLEWEANLTTTSHPEQTLPLPRWAGFDGPAPELAPEHF